MENNETAAMWQHVHAELKAFIAKRVRIEAEADDILQDVFLRVHRHIMELHHPDRLTAWIYQITRRVIVDYYRSPKRRREISVGLAADLHEDVAGSDDVMETNAKTDLSGCLRPMLNRLLAEYRDAIRLVEIEGLTHQQAARQLGLSVPGMKSRVQRGRQQLRNLLRECCVIKLDRRGGVNEYRLRRPGSGC
jgi:RNA polymerase sigma-70 factor (ECF subfamily)